jgi:hypothetical protein
VQYLGFCRAGSSQTNRIIRSKGVSLRSQRSRESTRSTSVVGSWNESREVGGLLGGSESGSPHCLKSCVRIWLQFGFGLKDLDSIRSYLAVRRLGCTSGLFLQSTTTKRHQNGITLLYCKSRDVWSCLEEIKTACARRRRARLRPH